MTTPEIGAVYTLPSGAFAFLTAVAEDGTWTLEVVNVHRAEVVENRALDMSPRMGARLSIAWHPHQWAEKVLARVAQNKRTKQQAEVDEQEGQQRRDSWARAQTKIMEAAAYGHQNV